MERRRTHAFALVLSTIFVVFALVLAAVPVSAANPSVTTVAAAGIGDSSATLNGNLAALGSGNTKVQVGFLWGTNSTLSGATNVTVGYKTATGTFAKTLYGLVVATKYYFRAWARNYTGDVARSQFAQGSILNFTTTNSVGLAAGSLMGILPTLVTLIVTVMVFSLLLGVVGTLFGKFEAQLGRKKGGA